MTVAELIQRLSTHNQDRIVLIEVNHDEHIQLENSKIVTEDIVEENGNIQIANEESENTKEALVIIA